MLKGRALGYARLMHEELVTSTRHWGQEGEIDLPQVTNELTVNIASRVAVVGAGPVGAVAALAHARRGARVALCEANPSSARRLAGEWLHPPAIQVLRELGIDLPSAILEHAAGQGFVVFPDDGSAPCLLPYGYSCRHQTLVETLRRSAASHPGVEYRPGVRVRRIEGRSLHRRGPCARHFAVYSLPGAFEGAANGVSGRRVWSRRSGFLVGDAVGYHHPLTAVGMALGFKDALCLAQCQSVAEYRGRRRPCLDEIPETNYLKTLFCRVL